MDDLHSPSTSDELEGSRCCDCSTHSDIMAAATGAPENSTAEQTQQAPQAEHIMRLPPLPNPLSQRGPAAFAQAGQAMNALHMLSAGAANGTVGEDLSHILALFN